MKLVNINSGEIGLLVELPAGPHVVDIAKSFQIFATHDPVSGALINGALKERSPWVALINHWRYLRVPFALLARIALANPDDPRLVIYPYAHARQAGESPPGIVALDITDVADLEVRDPTGRLVMAKQFSEPAVEHAKQDVFSMGENVQVVDFSRHNDQRTRRQ